MLIGGIILGVYKHHHKEQPLSVFSFTVQDNGWFDPSWSDTMDSVLEAQPQWQLKPFGKFYRERDLMGRHT